MRIFILPSGSGLGRFFLLGALACAGMGGCKDAAADLQIRVTALQAELAKKTREIEKTQKELALAKDEVKAAEPQPAASVPSAPSGVSRQELDEALKTALARFKSELAVAPVQAVAPRVEPPVEVAAPPQRPAVGGPNLPVTDTRSVDWGDKKPRPPTPPNAPPIQRPPVAPQRPSSNLPPANQEVPIKF